ncbi:histidine kinase [Deinococcus sp. RL]|uniref:sensor histidine kinase n=1 Tax=Deinococcus sp. RL TaxID=1489678 RepID=UPI0004D58098|nr:HAMP domain-containing sensor histidine kinase [Deinococcus sp. RL]KEF34090.1 histidine kinase [Deinococcus sp. RL]
MSLRWRLTVFYTALVALVLAAVSVAGFLTIRGSLLGNLARELNNSYLLLRDVVPGLNLKDPSTSEERDAAGILPRAVYLFPDDAIQVEELPTYDLTSLQEAFAQAQSPQARRQLLNFVRSQASSRRQFIRMSEDNAVRLSDEELARLIGSPNGRLLVDREVRDPYTEVSRPHRFLVVLGPLQLDPGAPPNLAIAYIGRRLDPALRTLAQLQRGVLALSLLGLLAAALGAYVLAGRALRPLREVRQAAEGIGGQNLDERVPVPPTGDEVEALAQALNAMLARLQASFEAQRRFTSDASHELRTPVTAISGHAGYLLRRTNPTGQQRESLNIIRSESERLTNLIASLLELARSDSGALTLTRQPILSTLFLGEVARELAPLAQAQGSELRVTGEEVPFEGDPDRLKQVLINLVGNALKAGASTVTLTSTAQDGGREVRLSVADDGPGIPPEHLSRLFDRFYRVEDSRSRDAGGAGLGLSIAKGIVDAHGGRIWLESEVGRGTVAHVQLPVGDGPGLEDGDVP